MPRCSSVSNRQSFGQLAGTSPCSPPRDHPDVRSEAEMMGSKSVHEGRPSDLLAMAITASRSSRAMRRQTDSRLVNRVRNIGQRTQEKWFCVVTIGLLLRPTWNEQPGEQLPEARIVQAPPEAHQNRIQGDSSSWLT